MPAIAKREWRWQYVFLELSIRDREMRKFRHGPGGTVPD